MEQFAFGGGSRLSPGPAGPYQVLHAPQGIDCNPVIYDQVLHAPQGIDCNPVIYDQVLHAPQGPINPSRPRMRRTEKSSEFQEVGESASGSSWNFQEIGVSSSI